MKARSIFCIANRTSSHTTNYMYASLANTFSTLHISTALLQNVVQFAFIATSDCGTCPSTACMRMNGGGGRDGDGGDGSLQSGSFTASRRSIPLACESRTQRLRGVSGQGLEFYISTYLHILLFFFP